MEWLAGLVVAGGTLRHVYRGGTTLNDHAVAAVVAGCVGIYPLLWWAAGEAGVAGPARVALGVLFGAAAVSIYALFHVLAAGEPPSPALPPKTRGGSVGLWLALASQPAIAFSLWAGLLVLLRLPVAAWLGARLWWPGPLLLLPACLALRGFAWTRMGLRRVRTLKFEVAGLPAPVTVVHLSDLHVGPTMPRADVAALVNRVREIGPDLVIITGDFVTPFSEGEHGSLLEHLPRLGAPTFACLGNHDLPIADSLPAELAAVGIPVLVDAATTLQVGPATVELVGVNFHWRKAREHLEAALGALPPAEAHLRILLAHDPRLFAWVPGGRFHLVLAGHTHGGQVGTDMLGIPWSVLRPLGVYDQGVWTRGATRLYVHRGNWHTGLPPRMGIAGEIAVHRLVPARQASSPPHGA